MRKRIMVFLHVPVYAVTNEIAEEKAIQTLHTGRYSLGYKPNDEMHVEVDDTIAIDDQEPTEE